MADEKGYTIPIFINPVQRGNGDTGGGSDGEGDSYLPMPPQDGMDEDHHNAVVSSQSRTNPAKAILTKMAKQAAATALNNYGNITGDYVAQQNLQTVVGEAGAIAGAIAMGPVGMALYAIDKGFQVFNYISQLKRSETESAFKQKRVYASNRRS